MPSPPQIGLIAMPEDKVLLVHILNPKGFFSSFRLLEINPILGGWGNLPTPVISFNNGAMGMKLGMYLKYHEKFSISSKNFDGCADIGIFFC